MAPWKKRAAAAIALGGLALAAGGLASLAWGSPLLLAVTGWVLAPLAFLAAAPIVNRIATWGAGPRGPVAAWLAATVAAVALILLLQDHLEGRLKSALFALERNFTRLVQQIEPQALLVAIALAVAFAVGASLMRSRPVSRTPRAFALAASGAAIGLALLAGLAFRRSERYPIPDRYLDRLPVVGVVPGAPRMAAHEPALEEPSVSYVDRSVGPYLVRRFHFTTGTACGLVIATPGDSVPATMTYGQTHLFDCDPVTVWRDESHGVFIARAGTDWGPLHVVREATGERLPESSVSTAMFTDRMAPYPSFTLAAFAGIGIAILALASPSRERRHLARRAAWREGSFDAAEGIVRLTEGALWRPPLPVLRRLASGPVTLLEDKPQAQASYRVAPDIGEVLMASSGPPEQVEALLRARIEARHAFALAAVSLLGAPLVAEALAGLVLS